MTKTRVSKHELDDIARSLSSNLLKRGHNCVFIVRAPGRVNLIGEHIDYNGYPVLPMTLKQALYIAVAYNNDFDSDKLCLYSTVASNEDVKISLTDANKFGDNGPPEKPEWFHYFLCGYRGILDYAVENDKSWNPRGLTVLVGGPEYGGLSSAAGLSSSSAFVVAASLVTMHANNLDIDKSELAALCARSEQYIGTQGGGMDQAASLLGSEDEAMLVEFTKPMLTIHPITLPGDFIFVIAHSNVHARKSATSYFNERVTESRLAARLLVSASPHPDFGESPNLRDAQLVWKVDQPMGMLDAVANVLGDRVWYRNELVARVSPQSLDSCLTPKSRHMQQFVIGNRARHVYSEAGRVWQFYQLCIRHQEAGDSANLAHQLGALMDASHDSCRHLYECSCSELDELVDALQQFVIGNRARHVYSEAGRVWQFYQLCIRHQEAGDSANLAHQLGALMDASHDSCRHLYECSCSELDELVDACRKAGALGSRLTGAGWGGCVVSLVRRKQVNTFIYELKATFYAPRGLVDSCVIFASQPGPAASIMQLERLGAK